MKPSLFLKIFHKNDYKFAMQFVVIFILVEIRGEFGGCGVK
jgi:hypothetical protein